MLIDYIPVHRVFHPEYVEVPIDLTRQFRPVPRDHRKVLFKSIHEVLYGTSMLFGL